MRIPLLQMRKLKLLFLAFQCETLSTPTEPPCYVLLLFSTFILLGAGSLSNPFSNIDRVKLVLKGHLITRLITPMAS